MNARAQKWTKNTQFKNPNGLPVDVSPSAADIANVESYLKHPYTSQYLWRYLRKSASIHFGSSLINKPVTLSRISHGKLLLQMEAKYCLTAHR